MLPSRHRLLGRLHRSNHFDVFDAWDTGRGCRCIVKTPRPDRRDDAATGRQLRREGRRLMRWSHPHLVRAWEMHDDPQPYVVMETLTGATLGHMIDDAVRPLPASQAAWLGLHLTSAVGFLHRQGVLHLDLKPTNIVATGGKAVILDLSVSRPPGHMRGGLGTRGYMAPEQQRPGVVDAAADVWGIAVVLYEVLTGEPACGRSPRRDEPIDVPAARRARMRGPLAGVLRACLDPDPGSRPSLPVLEQGLATVAGLDRFPPR